MVKPKYSRNSSNSDNDNINPDNIDFNKKILHAAWHPLDNLVAVGASNNMFIFTADPVKQ